MEVLPRCQGQLLRFSILNSFLICKMEIIIANCIASNVNKSSTLGHMKTEAREIIRLPRFLCYFLGTTNFRRAQNLTMVTGRKYSRLFLRLLPTHSSFSFSGTTPANSVPCDSTSFQQQAGPEADLDRPALRSL